MKLFRRRNTRSRAEDLNQLSYSLYRRVSRNPSDRLEIGLDADENFLITRRGYPRMRVTLDNRRQVEKYLRKFYSDISFNGSGAPNDIFLDSLQQVTTEQKK